MILTDKELKDRISSPRNSSAIDLARNQEERLLLHCENIQEKYSLPFWAYRNFTLWWQSLITKEKHEKIESLLTTPLASTSLTEEMFQQIGKFRDAQDRYIAFEFASVDFTNDYADFLSKTNDDTFWRDNCLNALKSGINDIVVVDLPAIQTTERPEPYQYLVSPTMFVDLEINKFTGNVEYFIFRQSEFKWDSALSNCSVGTMDAISNGQRMQKMIAVDDMSYRIMAAPSDSKEFFVMETIEHNLGYCPCIDFWQPSIKGSNGINKNGVLTGLLSKLDKYLFYCALVDYMDIYGAFPIFVTYAMDEEQWDDKRKDVNFGQYYNPQVSTYIGNDGAEAQNPRVSYKWVGAPGSVIEYQQPADGNDVNFVKDPPRYITMPVEALKHVNDRCKTLKAQLMQYATGENTEYMNEVAKNADMMDASFNKQDSILTFIKRQVERVHRFCTKTKAELRYGKEYFISCTVDYGSDYFLKDANRIVSEYKEAVESGMHPEYCNQLAIEATNTRFKNNPDVLARQRILRDIIPYADMTLSDLIQAGINESDVPNFVIRINSVSFVQKFELEFGDIVKFGKNLKYSDKIFHIQNQLKTYGKEQKWVQVARPVPTTVTS